jgi:hypothetical protein
MSGCATMNSIACSPTLKNITKDGILSKHKENTMDKDYLEPIHGISFERQQEAPMRKFVDCLIFFFVLVCDIMSFRTMHSQTMFCGCRNSGRAATEA